jgi:carbon-monoxide dehydrogenase large subunit
MTATTDAPAAELEIGRARLRKEDARLITGQTNWTDNMRLPGMLHLAFLRSPFAHAKITRVDVSAALEQPGVIAAFSGADFAAEQGSLPCAWPVTEDIQIPAHPPMAVDEVRYVGEAVAVVVARDRYTAADALNAIDVDYDPLSRPVTRATSGCSPTATWTAPSATRRSWSSGPSASSASSRARWSRGRWSPSGTATL